MPLSSCRAHLPPYKDTPLLHGPDVVSRLQVWCLASQIDHKVAFLKEHVLLPGRPPVVLMAHSIGTYMMLHALQELEADPGLQASGTPQVLKVCSTVVLPLSLAGIAPGNAVCCQLTGHVHSMLHVQVCHRPAGMPSRRTCMLHQPAPCSQLRMHCGAAGGAAGPSSSARQAEHQRTQLQQLTGSQHAHAPPRQQPRHGT